SSASPRQRAGSGPVVAGRITACRRPRLPEAAPRCKGRDIRAPLAVIPPAVAGSERLAIEQMRADLRRARKAMRPAGPDLPRVEMRGPLRQRPGGTVQHGPRDLARRIIGRSLADAVILAVAGKGKLTGIASARSLMHDRAD